MPYDSKTAPHDQQKDHQSPKYKKKVENSRISKGQIFKFLNPKNSQLFNPHLPIKLENFSDPHVKHYLPQ